MTSDNERLDWYFENFRKTRATLVCQDTEIDKEAWEKSIKENNGKPVPGIPKRPLPKDQWEWIWCIPDYRGIPLMAIQPEGAPFRTPQEAIDALMKEELEK